MLFASLKGTKSFKYVSKMFKYLKVILLHEEKELFKFNKSFLVKKNSWVVYGGLYMCLT